MCSREYIVDADDAMRSGRSTVVDDSRVALHPHPASILRHESIILGCHLTFQKHCKTNQTLLGHFANLKWNGAVLTPFHNENIIKSPSIRNLPSTIVSVNIVQYRQIYISCMFHVRRTYKITWVTSGYTFDLIKKMC